MDPVKQREIASKGGRAAPRKAPLTNGLARKPRKPDARAALPAIGASRLACSNSSWRLGARPSRAPLSLPRAESARKSQGL
jgi:hypothetical protein